MLAQQNFSIWFKIWPLIIAQVILDHLCKISIIHAVVDILLFYCELSWFVLNCYSTLHSALGVTNKSVYDISAKQHEAKWHIVVKCFAKTKRTSFNHLSIYQLFCRFQKRFLRNVLHEQMENDELDLLLAKFVCALHYVVAAVQDEIASTKFARCLRKWFRLRDSLKANN